MLLRESAKNSMRKTIKKLLDIACFSFVLVLAGCLEEETLRPESDPEQADPSKTVRGPLDVYFTLQTSSSSTAGTGRTPMKASAIHFFDTYIVVEVPDSGGRVFPSDKIIDFSWSGGGRVESVGRTEGGD